MIKSKEELFKMLYDNPVMKAAMSKISDEKELRVTKAAVEELVGKFYDGLNASTATIQEAIQKDPEGFKKAVTEYESSLINEEGDVKKSNEDG